MDYITLLDEVEQRGIDGAAAIKVLHDEIDKIDVVRLSVTD